MGDEEGGEDDGHPEVEDGVGAEEVGVAEEVADGIGPELRAVVARESHDGAGHD